MGCWPDVTGKEVGRRGSCGKKCFLSEIVNLEIEISYSIMIDEG